MSTLRYADIPVIQNLINKIKGALNTKQDIIQYDIFPTNNTSLIGIIAQYTGTTTEQYTQGRFYMCKQDSTDNSIVWEEVNKIDTYDVLQCTHDQYDEMDALGEIPDGTLVLFTDSTTDTTPTENSTNYVTSGGVYAAIYTKQDTIQFNTMPTASAEFSGKIIQYVGNTNSTYINGYFYKCIEEITEGNSTSYKWNRINVQPEDNSVELTQAEYDALGNEKYHDNKDYYITDAEPNDVTYIYGFHIDPDESDSSDAVTYLKDAVGMTPASMGTTSFNLGSWENAFFMPRPCMLKFDGTVDYYLDPNDYSKKADGTASDYNNLNYEGNAMMEFPLIWFKWVQGTASGEGYFYCSNHKVDDTYKCWCNLDCDGNIIDHFYMPIYNCCVYNGKMRSISGLKLTHWSTTAYSSSTTYAVDAIVNYQGKMYKCITAVETAEEFDSEKWEQFAFNGNTSGTEEINYAKANNTTDKIEWYTNVLCDRMLINGLLILISKSLATQESFGRGIELSSQTAKEAYVTGSLDNMGLFYGSSGSTSAVKVFGMENWWGCVWHRTAGLIGGSNNNYLYKMTASTADGSTADGYNTTSEGYLSIGNKPATNNYIKKMQYGLWGCLPIEVGSYSTQYFRDYWYNGTGYALFGGYAGDGAIDGAFSASLNRGVGNRYWAISSDLSCKPCLEGVN